MCLFKIAVSPKGSGNLSQAREDGGCGWVVKRGVVEKGCWVLGKGGLYKRGCTSGAVQIVGFEIRVCRKGVLLSNPYCLV